MPYQDNFSKQLQTITPLMERIKNTMEQEHHIAEGIFGIPSGCAYTFSRAEFYDKALKLGACTQAEYNQLYGVLVSIWNRDLSD